MDPLDKPYTTSCGHTWTMRHTACPECFAALREENERLRADLSRTLAEVERPFRQRIEELERTRQILVNKAVGGMDLGRYEKYTIIRTDKLEELTRERNEARAEVERMTNLAALREENERLKEALGEDVLAVLSRAHDMAIRASDAERERDEARREVARLEGLILNAREAVAAEIEKEAKAVPPGDSWWGGPLHGASVYNVMMWAVRRIRAVAKGE